MHGTSRQGREGSTAASVTSCPPLPEVLQPTSTPEPHTANTPANGTKSSSCTLKYAIRNEPSKLPTLVPILPKPVPPTLPPMRPEYLRFAENWSLGPSGTLAKADNPVSAPTGGYGIDVGRLRGIYDKYSGAFWNAIVAEYSNDRNITGSYLEAVLFEKASFSVRALITPTPTTSPRCAVRTLSDTKMPSSETKVEGASLDSHARSPVNKFTVASLLTVERDVWAWRDNSIS